MKPSFEHLEKCRVLNTSLATKNGDHFGLFIFKRNFLVIRCIASDGADDGWEHVSVSMHNSKGVFITPSWDDMCFVKEKFWNEDETVIQFHPRKEDYVKLHKHCLHLWKPINQFIQTPPLELI